MDAYDLFVKEFFFSFCSTLYLDGGVMRPRIDGLNCVLIDEYKLGFD